MDKTRYLCRKLVKLLRHFLSNETHLLCVKENYYFDIITVLFAFYSIYFHVSFSGIILNNIDFVILQLDCLFKCLFYYIKFHFFFVTCCSQWKIHVITYNTYYYHSILLLPTRCYFMCFLQRLLLNRYIFERRLVYFLYSCMLIGHRPPFNRLVNIFFICYNNKLKSQILYESEQMMLHLKSIVMTIFFSAG